MIRALEVGCVAEFGHWEREPWHALMGAFRDANLYQTWSYDRVRYARRDVVHMVLRRGGAPIAAAQGRVVRFPGTRAGIAYMRWGPMWRPVGSREDREVFRQAVRALRNELSHRRGLVLRLYPLAYRGQDDALEEILREEGYRFHPTAAASDRTLILDLDAPVESLRAALDQKWRNHLNRAERNRLDLLSGTDDHLFEEIAGMYAEMAARKGLPRSSDVGHLREVQRDLPEHLKLRVILCRLNGAPCAGAIFGAVGTAGLYIRGATSDVGLKTNASYLVQWAFVRWLKERGYAAYDLNGMTPDANPGTYYFKRGLAGKRGRDVHFLGRFQVADSAVSSWMVKEGERLLAGYRRAMAVARSLRRRDSQPAV